MNTVLSLIILIRQNSLKKDNNYIIADYILNHVPEIEKKSIQEMANDCHVSTNTILRFCQTLGFSTFKRFKNMLISTMKTRRLQLSEKNRYLNIQQIGKQMSSLTVGTFDEKDYFAKLDELVSYIRVYRKIHLYGAVFPLALSQSFIEDMALLGVACEVHQFHYGMEELNQDDGIHLAISYSGRLIEANRDEYNQILGMREKKVLISRMEKAIGQVDLHLVIPQTESGHYDDLFLLLIYDYLLFQYSCLETK